MKIIISQNMKKYILSFCLLYIGGFLIGTVVMNVMYNQFNNQSSMLGLYFMSQDGNDFSKKEYFCQLLTNRGTWFLLYSISGVTAFGIPMVIGCLLWSGFLAGSLMTMFLLEFGIRGMFLGFACFVPQCFIYIPATLFLFVIIYRMSRQFWPGVNESFYKYRTYALLVLGIGVVYLWGIVLESYVNYHVLQYIKTLL